MLVSLLERARFDLWSRLLVRVRDFLYDEKLGRDRTPLPILRAVFLLCSFALHDSCSFLLVFFSALLTVSIEHDVEA